MTLHQWIFGGINNPPVAGQWGALHIITLVICTALMIGFPLLVKRVKNGERAKRIIVLTLAMLILFFEIAIRIVYTVKLFHLHAPEMEGLNMLWIILPKPWCAISCWLLVASVFVRRSFFYDFASLSAMICSVIYFCYPGTGFNNQYILFENLYSIVTHALLLTTSVTLITLGFAGFRARDILKTVAGIALTVVYALGEIYLLEPAFPDPMYFMPGGDIQQDILGVSYGLYLFLYILLIAAFILTPYCIASRHQLKERIGRIVKKK